jgi:hypothetical protein
VVHHHHQQQQQQQHHQHQQHQQVQHARAATKLAPTAAAAMLYNGAWLWCAGRWLLALLSAATATLNF